MKNLFIYILLGLLSGYLAVLSGCAVFNDLTVDDRTEYDSVSQIETGRPNEGGTYTEKSGLEAAVTGAMIKRIKGDAKSSSEEKVEAEKKAQSILRIEGSLFGIIANPDPHNQLSIVITEKSTGAMEPHTLLPKSCKEIFLPTGDYKIEYIKNGEIINNGLVPCYTVTMMKSGSYSLQKGWKYEKLKFGSMEDYEPITKAENDIIIPVRFQFIGSER